VAPYLAYLRQDRRFRSGEAVSARHFSHLLAESLDWVVTVDPHLHRIHGLAEVYPISTESVTAAPRLAAWIRDHVPVPVLIGRDEESRQWVSQVAADAAAPWVVFRKRRLGDERVSEELPDMGEYRDRTPVLVDDIISSGATMVQSARVLVRAGLAAPRCVAVHGIFAGGAYARLMAAGVAGVVTSNSIAHSSNAIDVHDLLAAAALRQLTAAAANSGGRSW
jgi:ribose-phosphate pyrophosphokinase